MEEILSKLYTSLEDAFQEYLKPKEIQYFSDTDTIDVFKTLMFLKKNKNELNRLMLCGSVSVDELTYLFDKEVYNECLNNKFIIKGTAINSDKVFIGANGLFKLYTLKNYNTDEVFMAYDEHNFVLEKDLVLKTQEKIWCIFLLLFGADNKDSSFDTQSLSNDKLKDYHNFFKTIESAFNDKGLSLGKKIGWDTGKDSVFRKFITNNVDLPKTHLYHNINKYKYYLDIGNRRNAKYLLDLILDKFEGEQRLLVNGLFYNVLKDLEFRISLDLFEIPGKINKYIIQELQS